MFIFVFSGSVYSCGLNDSHQLGQQSVVDKCLVPKQVSNKGLKGKTVIGVDAGRFHSLIYTASSLFTCGLNAGQLGMYNNFLCSDFLFTCLLLWSWLYFLDSWTESWNNFNIFTYYWPGEFLSLD